MKTLKNKNIVRLLILISLIVVVGISFIVTTAVYKGTHTGSGSLVLDKGIYIDISDVSSGELSKNMEMPIQYYPNKVTSEGNRIQFSVKPSSKAEYYIANPTITAQDSSQAFYLRLKLNAQYYVNGSSTPTTFSMSASERNTLFKLFATDSNYSPVLFNDCFAADANGEYYYYVSGGYGVATKNNLAQVTSGMEISLFKGFLVNGTTPVSVINFREFENVPENVTNITLTLDIELAIEPNNWNLPDVTLLTENDVTISLVDGEYEITKINTSATTYALPGYYQGNAITRIGTTTSSALDDDAVTVWFANTMTHVGGYATSKIQKFYLGNNVTEICEWAFYGTHELSGNLVLPISITKIADDSFGDVTTISCLFPYLPNCEYFGSGSFKGDSGFYGILSVRGVIGSTAFADVSVRTLNIEAGTTSIGTDSFYGMQGLRRVFIDSSAIAGLNSSASGLLDLTYNVSLQDIYIKDGLTIGAYFTSDSNFVETESNVAGYRHFGRSYQLTFNGGNIDGTLDAKLWNYAGSAGYSSSNTGNNGKYTFSGKNATTNVGLNGVNSFYLPMPIISGYTFDGWYTTANGVVGGAKVATADGWIANVSGYTSENGYWIRASATTLYAHYTKKEYSISYDFAGGSKGTNAPSSYIFGNTTAISNPTRAGYTFVGWDISVSLTGRSLATIEINSGVQQYSSSYPTAVYYELFYAHQGISYTAALSGGQIRWRGYTTAGAYSSSLSSSSNYTLSSDAYIALWYHLGKEDNNTTYSYNYTGDNFSIDSLQVGNLTLTAKWVQNNSYLLIADSWKSNLASAVGGSISNINSILFTQDASKIPSGKTGVSVGATDIDGQTAYSNMKYVSDITAYVVANGSKYDVIFYAPCPMYAPTDSSNLFNNLTGLTSIELAALKTNKVTNMARMFQKDSSLTSISLSSLDTSLVIDLKGMFDGCTMLTSLDLSSFNTSNVTTIAGMFKNCSSLETLNLSSFNTSKVTGMNQTFMGCSSLRTIDLSNFDTSLVTNMASLFNDCTELREVKLGSKFVTTNAGRMDSMFYSCKNLESAAIKVLLNRFNTSKVTTMSNMFNGCLKLISIDLNTFDMSNVTDTTDMLANCEQLRVIKTPVALSSTAIVLPYGTWYDEDDLSVGYTKIEKALVTGGWKTIRPGYSVTYNAIATKDYSESNLRSEYAKGNIYNYNAGYFAAQDWYDLSEVYPDLMTYSSITYRYLQILPKVSSRWTNSSIGVISAEAYVLGNAQYHVRVPRGYYIEIKQIDYENNELSQSWTLGKEYVSGESDLEESIVTNSKTHKLVFTLRHSTKSLTPSSIETSALANLHVTLESPTVTNIWYGQDIPMVSSYSPGMNFHDTIKSMTGVTNTKGEYDQTFVSFDTATSLGDITQIVTYSPITYTIKLKTGNGKYNDQSGTITLGTGYMGQKIDIKRSLITLPIGNLLKSITQSGKGQFVDIGAYGNSLFTDFDEWQYQIGAGDATLTLKFTPMTFDVSFDANGGNVDPSTISVSYGSSYGELPTPSRTGYTFDGWYTASSGGTKVESSTKFTITSNQTLYAHWTENTTAYLMTGSNWQAKLKAANSSYTQANIESIEFTSTKPTSGTRVSVGAINADGTTAYVSGTSGVSDVIAYVTAGSTSGKYKIVFYSNATIYAPKDSSYLFSASTSSSQLKALKSIAFNNFNTSNVNDMHYMFYNCSSLTSLNLENFNTAKVTTMYSMFAHCSSLSSINVSSFNTANVTNMRSMFSNCSSLSSINVSSFNTANVTIMSYMFNVCSSLTSINVSNFNTSQVTNMSFMFASTNLSSLDISNFDMSKVTEVGGMLSFSTSQFNFYELITPKKMATLISLPFSFCLASDYSGDYLSIPSSLTLTKLLPKYVQVSLTNTGNWEKCSLTTNCSGLNDGATVTVVRGTYIEFYLNAKGVGAPKRYVCVTFNQLNEKPTYSNVGGPYSNFGVYDRAGNKLTSLITDNKLSIDIIDDRTNVEEIDIKNEFIIDSNDNNIEPVWFTVPNYWAQLVSKSWQTNSCYATIKIRVSDNATYIRGYAGEGDGYTSCP